MVKALRLLATAAFLLVVLPGLVSAPAGRSAVLE
jgi:hypothetical protein